MTENNTLVEIKDLSKLYQVGGGGFPPLERLYSRCQRSEPIDQERRKRGFSRGIWLRQDHNWQTVGPLDRTN